MWVCGITSILALGILALAWRLSRSFKLSQEANELTGISIKLITELSKAFLLKLLISQAALLGILFLFLYFSFNFNTAFSCFLGVSSGLIFTVLSIKAMALMQAKILSVHQVPASVEPEVDLSKIVAVIGFLLVGMVLLIAALSYLLIQTSESLTPIVSFILGISFFSFSSRLGVVVCTQAISHSLYLRYLHSFSKQLTADAGVCLLKIFINNLKTLFRSLVSLFESYTLAVIICMLIAANMALSENLEQFRSIYMYTPLVMVSLGAFSSFIAIKIFGVVQVNTVKTKAVSVSLKKSYLFASALFVLLMLLYSICWSAIGFWHWLAILFATIISFAFINVFSPVLLFKSKNDNSLTSKFKSLYRSLVSVSPLLLMAACLGLSNWCSKATSEGFYCIALATVAILVNVGIVAGMQSYLGLVASLKDLLLEKNISLEQLADDSVGLEALQLEAESKNFLSLDYGVSFLIAIAIFGAYAQAVGAEEIDLSILNPNMLAGATVGLTLSCTVVVLGSHITIWAYNNFSQKLAEIHDLLLLLETNAGEILNSIRSFVKMTFREINFLSVLAVLAPILLGFMLGSEALSGMLLGLLLCSIALAVLVLGLDELKQNSLSSSNLLLNYPVAVPFSGLCVLEVQSGFMGQASLGSSCQMLGDISVVLVKLVPVLAWLMAPLLLA